MNGLTPLSMWTTKIAYCLQQTKLEGGCDWTVDMGGVKRRTGDEDKDKNTLCAYVEFSKIRIFYKNQTKVVHDHQTSPT